jgi:hypothetical protein
MNKKLLLSTVAAIALSGTNVGLAKSNTDCLKVTVDEWHAVNTQYTEVSTPRTAIGPHGELDTDFVKLMVEKGFGNIILEGGAKAGSIHKKTMYLTYDETSWVRINGSIYGGEFNGYYRFGDRATYVDLGAGYSFAWTTKEFYDYYENGVAQANRTGNFGRFKMNHQVLAAKMRLRAMSGDFGLEGKGSYGKAWNKTHVVGWDGGPTTERADGYDYQFDIAGVWQPSKQTELKAGYRHERLCFDPATPAGHDLDVKYNGPFIAVSWIF